MGVTANIVSLAPRSAVEATLEVLDDRWKVLIVWHLFWGARPFSELMRASPGITKKALRTALAEMERCGLVCKEDRPRESHRVVYSLTALGETLKPIVGAMHEWGLRFGAPAIERPTSSDATLLRVQDVISDFMKTF